MTDQETREGIWPYLGVGCLTAVIGLAGGGMLAVLVAKVIGAIQGCTPAPDTGAPCNWTEYRAWGARLGFILLPTFALWRLWRSRHRSPNTADRG